MLTPAKAPVRPRVRSPLTGEVVLLEDVIHDYVMEGEHGLIAIVGGPGTGKTTALSHLLALQNERAEWRDDVAVLEGGDPDEFRITARLLVFAGRKVPKFKAFPELQLCPWGRDELIEYLLAVHPEHCKSVMSRIGDRLPGDWRPCIWRIVLDDMTADESLTPEQALNQKMHLALQQRLSKVELSVEFEQLLEQPVVAVQLAGEMLAEKLAGKSWVETLMSLHSDKPIALNVLKITGLLIAGNTLIESRLNQALRSRRYQTVQALAATLLRLADPAWRPERLASKVRLRRACLDGVAWSELDLKRADLLRASLVGANLTSAILTHSTIISADLSYANLTGARLLRVEAQNVNLSHADCTGSTWVDARLDVGNLQNSRLDRCEFRSAILFGSDLRHASCREADFRNANLMIATLASTDLTNANLSFARMTGVDLTTAVIEGADFNKAVLEGAKLERVVCPKAQFAAANLKEADLTGSKFFLGNFRKAILRQARLGEIVWEGADLRGADLFGATFHMGSSRSGMLFSPYASEGSKTGFYTDDFTEQHYKPIEEIRKASLRNADLRGANLTNVDFYLVDLRGAQLDERQRDYVRRCGAILCESE